MSATSQNETTFEVMWHNEYDGFNFTKIDAASKPLNCEAAQLVAIIEDVDVTGVTVDSVTEVEG